MTSLRSERLVVRCCTEFGDLQALAEAWNNLVDDSAYPNVFLRWEWVGTWWKWFGDGRPLRVYLVYDGSQLVGILPLYARRRALCGISRRMVLAPIGFGGPTCPEYLGLIVHREALEAVVQRLAAELRSPDERWTAIELPDVAPDDPGTRKLVERFGANCRVLSRPGVTCPSCGLPSDYEALLARLSSHGRQRERRQLRRILEDLNGRLEVIKTAEAAEGFLPLLTALSRSSRGRACQSSPFENSAYLGFHRQVMAAMSLSRLLRIHVLHLGDRPAAFLYGFLYNGKYYFFQTGFDLDQWRASPGAVLLQMTFEQLIAESAGEFDYLRGDEGYKYVFADRERRTTTFYVFPSVNPAYLRYWSRLRIGSPLRRRAKWVLERLRGTHKADGKAGK